MVWISNVFVTKTNIYHQNHDLIHLHTFPSKIKEIAGVYLWTQQKLFNIKKQIFNKKWNLSENKPFIKLQNS